MSTINGCDSIILTQLSVNTVDTSVVQNNNVLTANALNSNFKWYNCTNNTEINGAILNTYTAISNGAYAVIVTKGTCVDTSRCFNVTTIAINDLEFSNSIKITPNPTNGMLRVEFNNANKLELINNLGQVIFSKQITNNSIEEYLNLTEFESGIYFVKVYSKSGVILKKVIKEK